MFKIESLTLNNNVRSAVYPFSKNTYVFGGTASGKTLLSFLIDYMIGNNDVEISSREGLDNITSVELQLSNGEEILSLKREGMSSYYYKKSDIDSFSQCDEDGYKEEISLLLNKGDSSETILFNHVFNETLTYRAFSFLNFIEEKGLGDLSSIFTKAKEDKFSYRMKNIMSFLFNKKNLEIISKMNQKLAVFMGNYERLAAEKIQSDYCVSTITNEMKSINISTEGNLKEIKARFYAYKDNFNREKKPQKPEVSNDLSYLMKASFSLSEEIKAQQYYQKQTDKFASRNKKIGIVLENFKEIVSETNDYSKYSEVISKYLEANKKTNELLTIKDFEGTISRIQQRKNAIDQNILMLSRGLERNEYEFVVQKIGVIDHCFNEVGKFVDFELIQTLEHEIRQTKAAIKKYSNTNDDVELERVNTIINTLYQSLAYEIHFVSEDYENKNFAIDFNPNRLMISGVYTNSSGGIKYYTPGSMARQTTWQLCVYLGMFIYLRNMFKNMPALPILVIDGLQQPFDNSDDFPKIYDFLCKEASKIGLQTVMISNLEPVRLNIFDYLDISNGINPAHKQKK